MKFNELSILLEDWKPDGNKIIPNVYIAYSHIRFIAIRIIATFGLLQQF